MGREKSRGRREEERYEWPSLTFILLLQGTWSVMLLFFQLVSQQTLSARGKQ